MLEIHPFDAENRGISWMARWSPLESRSGDIALRARISERMQPGVVYTTFHHADDRRERGDDRPVRLGDQLPGIQSHRSAGAGAPTGHRIGRRSNARGGYRA